MLRHLMFVAGIGFLAVIAAVLYAQELQNRPPEASKAEAATQATPMPIDRSSMYRGGYDWNSRILERVRERLPLDEDEWAVLMPKLLPVIECQLDLRRGSVWSRSGYDDGSNTPMSRAIAELSNTLASPESSTAEIQTKVEELRRVRGQVEQELAAARTTLRDAVTVEEGAALTLLGILD